MRSRFEKQLAQLNKDLILMGSLCEDAIGVTLEFLETHDKEVLSEVEDFAKDISQMETDIENQCLKLLLRQQPVASDLRRISAALKLVYDMKRVGAQSAEISTIISLGHVVDGEEVAILQKMGKLVAQMVTESIDAFVSDDLALAEHVIGKDEQVDRDFDTIKQGLVRHFAKSDADGEYAVDVLMVAKYLERIGDHTVNIAKWVHYAVTGELTGG